LTGVKPHRFATPEPSREELVHTICEEHVILPSAAVKDREQRRRLRGDLDAILLLALQKDPSRRYQSVSEFAEDIRHHLVAKPVKARRHKTTYRIKTFFFQNRPFQFSVGAAALVCLGALLFSLSPRSGLKPAGLTSVSESERRGEAQLVPEKSIAVLPFEIFNNQTENAYFADGVQETILTDLANVAGLKVISRASVASYRGKAKNEREIGQTLGVSYVLQGSVQKDRDRVRVNAQLIDTRTMTQVWAQQYDRKLDDLFAVQSDLAQAIVSHLKGKLSPDEKAAIENRPTKNMLAYDLYLRA
jgi:TolB-like protein